MSKEVYQPVPKMLSFDVIITQVACGRDHAAFVTPNGLYTMGSNQHGKLGIGRKDLEWVSTPHIVKSIQMYSCKQVSWGWEHTAAVMKNGDFYIWGSSKYGAIGATASSHSWTPVKFKFRLSSSEGTKCEKDSSVKIKSVSCGSRFTCAIDSKGYNFKSYRQRSTLSLGMQWLWTTWSWWHRAQNNSGNKYQQCSFCSLRYKPYSRSE